MFNKKNLIPNPPAFYPPTQTKSLNRISKQEISPFKLNGNFVNEIRNDEESINTEMFGEYNQIETQAIYPMNELRNAVIKKEIPKNENSGKTISIEGKILNVNRQHKGKGPEILNAKQML